MWTKGVPESAGDIGSTLIQPGTQLRCNTGQTREEKVAYLCGICNPKQTLATPELSLVMSRSAVRVRSSALSFCLDKPIMRDREIYLVTSQGPFDTTGKGRSGGCQRT